MPRFAFALRLQHRLGHFLDEQRNAIGAFDNVVPDVRRQRLVADDAVDHGGDFALAKPIEGKGGYVRPSNPRRFKLRSVRDDQQRAQSSYTVHRSTEGFQASWVGPVGILKNHQHRILAAQRLHLRSKRFHRLLPPLLRGHFERRIASIIRKRQHFGKECRVLAWRKTLRQQGIEFVELRLRRVVVRESGGALHLADDWIERAVGVLRGAEVAQPRVWLRSETFQQRRRQSRLAYARLTGEQDHLAFTGLRFRPAAQQQFEFFVSPNKSGEAARVQRLEAAFTEPGRSAAQPRTGPAMPLRSFDPRYSNSNRSPISCRVLIGDDHHVRFGDPLQPGREVRRLANDTAAPAPHPIRSGRQQRPSRRDANAGLQRNRRLELTHRRYQLQALPAPLARRRPHALADSRSR